MILISRLLTMHVITNIQLVNSTAFDFAKTTSNFYIIYAFKSYRIIELVKLTKWNTACRKFNALYRLSNF